MAAIRMEPYYIQCIKDGSFKPKMTEDDIIESAISCETAKDTWTDLVHSFEGLSDTKENRIMDLKLEYQTFRAKSSKTLSQTYTHYKTLLNELANDGVTLSKHEINDFQENSDDEADERTSEEYLRDLDIEFHERALMANSKHFIKRKNIFRVKKQIRHLMLQSHYFKLQNLLNPLSFVEFHIVDFDPFVSFFILLSKFFYIIKSIIPNKDYKTEYKKLKAKLALFEASPPTSLSSKPFQPKNKGLVAETFDWVEEEVSNDEEETQVKVLMALADDELSVGKNHAHNGEWIDITMKKRDELLSKYNKIVFELNKCRDDLLVLKQVKLKADTFQIQNTELTKLNRALYDQLNEERKVNEKWLNSSNKSSKESDQVHTPIPSLKISGASPSLSLMNCDLPISLSMGDTGLETMKHTNPETQESSHKNFSGPLIISDPELVTSSVPTEVKTNDQDSKVNVLTKLRHIREPIWYLDSGCSRSMTGVKIYRHKYVEQLGPKVVFGDNSPCITEGYGSINCGGIVFSKKFDAKSDDGYFLGYSFNSKAFRVFNTKRQQIKETYHVTSDERIEVIRFTNTSVDEIGIGDLSRYPPDEFLQEDDPSRQYQTNSDISYYIIPHGRLLTELTQEKHVSGK
ncbi:hypothetical protein Tco_0060922 [Tanacetum coccineum]